MTSFELDPTSDIPAWIQLRQRIIHLINAGEYQAGDQLPTVRGLAAELSINFNTVSKTYISLERDGYITSSRRGAFVNELDDDQEEDGTTAVLAEEYVRTCLEEGFSFDDIRKQVNRIIKRIQKEREEHQPSRD